MVTFSFYDKNGTIIRNVDASDCIPDEVARLDIEGPFDCNTSSYKFLTTMLKSSPNRIEEIYLHGISEGDQISMDSPEFLSFLVLVYNKTNSLDIMNCFLSTNSMSCLMAALLTRDGIRRLSFAIEEQFMSNDETKILLEGVTCSPCLESFDFRVCQFEHNVEAGRILIKALNRNNSLKDITLRTSAYTMHDDEFLPNVLKATILSPNMKAVSIVDNGEQDLPLDVLQHLLCRKDCTLEKLHLDGVTIWTGDECSGSIVQNLSVKSLKVSQRLSGNGEILDIFKSLEKLDLYETGTMELSFLDPLLFGKSSKLKSLDLRVNRIDEGEMRKFIQKLRKVRGLKHLKMEFNPGGKSESVKTALTDALRSNTDLEHFDFDCLLLDLNRGGRRIFEKSAQPFPINLYPNVLERASKISYYKRSDCIGRPTNEEARADVVFWLTQRILPQL